MNARLVVEQRTDWGRTDVGKPVYKYVVTKAVNTTAHPLGAELSKAQVNELISLGVAVDIIPQKG